jgi:hypothetical protein
MHGWPTQTDRISTDGFRSFEMKQRLLVMNGQRLVQSELEGQWATNKVEKAGLIKPGIYNIHLAMAADKAKSYAGVILHADKEHVYQQTGKALIKHALTDFAEVPEVGSNFSIRYDNDKAVIAHSSVKHGRGISR